MNQQGETVATDVNLPAVWFLQDGKDGKERLMLYLDGADIPEGRTQYLVTVGTEANTTSATVTLPKYYEGHLINYSVKEVAVGTSDVNQTTGVTADERYTSTPLEGENGAKNTHTPETISFSATKTWNPTADGNTTPVYVRLRAEYAGIVMDETKIANSAWASYAEDFAPVMLSNENNWTQSWSNLPRFAPGKVGREVTYKIQELETYTVTDTSTEPETVTEYIFPLGYVAEGVNTKDDDHNQTYALTNTYHSVDVPIQKVWNDDDNYDGLRSESVTFNLKAKVGMTDITDDLPELLNKNTDFFSKTLNAEGDWRDTGWTNLPKYYHGKLITYTVEEATTPTGYTAAYSTSGQLVVDENDSNHETAPTRVITNTHEIYTTEITLTKTWDDDHNRDGARPDPDTFVGKLRLYAQMADEGNPVQLTVGTRKAGGGYVYPLMNDSTPFKDAEVEIIVHDNEGTDDTYEVVYRNLPRRRDSGAKCIVYTLSEDAIAGYTGDGPVTVSGQTEDAEHLSAESVQACAAAVTNTHTPGTIDITANKTWEHGANSSIAYPITVKLRLVATETEGGAEVPMTGDEWTGIAADKTLTFENAEETTKSAEPWTGLPTHVPGQVGVAITYSVEEVSIKDANGADIDGYHVTVTPGAIANGAQAIALRNEYEHVTVTATKTWDDANNQDGLRKPVRFILQQRLDGEETFTDVADAEVNEVGTGLSGDSLPLSVTWNNLPAWRGGKRIYYQVRETGPVVTESQPGGGENEEQPGSGDQQNNGEQNNGEQNNGGQNNGDQSGDVVTEPLTGYTDTVSFIYDTPAVNYMYTQSGTVTNAHTPETRDAYFKKHWVHNGASNYPAADEYAGMLRLWMRAGDSGEPTEVPRGQSIFGFDWSDADHCSVTEDANGDYIVRVTGLPKYQPKGTATAGAVEMQYFLSESASSALGYYTAVYPDSGSNVPAAADENAIDAANTLTNTRKTASLSLKKAGIVSDLASDHDENKEFTFDITSNPAVTGSYSYTIYNENNEQLSAGTLAFVSGLAASGITLKVGQYAVIAGLPIGVTYSATEIDNDDADHFILNVVVPTPEQNEQNEPTDPPEPTTPTYQPFTGVTLETENETESVDLINTRVTSDLVVEKHVVSALTADADKKFGFTVTLTGLTSAARTNPAYTYGITDKDEQAVTGSAEAPTPGENDSLVYTFELGDGESWTLHGLPTGVGYTVTETQDSDFVANNAEKSGVLGATGNTESFTNTRKTGSLTIDKAFRVANGKSNWISGDDDMDFEFVVTLSGVGAMICDNITWARARSNTSGKVEATSATADSDTTYTFKVKSSKNDPVTISGIPVGTTCTVKEAAHGSFSFVDPAVSSDANYSNDKTATILVDTESTTLPGGETKTVSFENERKTDGLKLSKTVVSPIVEEGNAYYRFQIQLAQQSGSRLKAEDSRNFTVTVDPEVPTITATGAIKEDVLTDKVTFNDKGVAVIPVKQGTVVTLSGIPVDLKYTVTETHISSQFAVAYDGATGTISETESGSVPPTATATNTRKTGDLRVEKEVRSNVAADKDAEYDFTVTLTNVLALAGGDGKIDVSKIAVERYNADKTRDTEYTGATVTDAGVFTFKLKHGQYVLIKGLPTGVGYTVRETTEQNNFTTKYRRRSNGYRVAYVTADDAIGTGEPDDVLFQNTRKTGALTLNKSLENYIADDVDDVFYFDVTLKNGDNTFPTQTDEAKIKVDGIEVTTTPPAQGETHKLYYDKDTGIIHDVPVKLGANGTGATVITGIPEGATYSATENQYWTNDTITEYTLSSGESGHIEFDATLERSSGESTMASDGSVSWSFTNKRRKGNLKISKTVESPLQAERDDPFRVKVTLKPVPEPVDGKREYKIFAETGTTLYNTDNTGDTKDTVTAHENIASDPETGIETTTYTISFDDNGVGYVYVYGDQTVEIDDLPTDVLCEVEEIESDGSQSSYVNYNEADVDQRIKYNSDYDKTVTATITNTRKTGKLAVQKTVVSDVTQDANQEFSFTVTLDNLDALVEAESGSNTTVDSDMITVKRYTGETEDTSFTSEGVNPGYSKSNDGTFTFKMKHGQRVEISGLPTGVTYTVQEAQAVDFNTTTKLNDGEWTAAKHNTDAATDIAFVTDSLTNEAPNDTAQFKNERKTGELAINKAFAHRETIGGADDHWISGDDDEKFIFNVAFTRGNSETLNLGTGTMVEVWVRNNSTQTETKQSTFTHTADTITVEASKNESIVIKGIPVGTTYTVTETGRKDADNNAIDLSNFDTPAPSPNPASRETERGTTEANTISTGGRHYDQSFTNYRKTNDLTIKKTVASPLTADHEAAYLVTVTLTDRVPAKRVYAITASDPATLYDDASESVKDDVTTGESGSTVEFKTVNGATSASIYIKDGQTVTIAGIPTDVAYTVSEAAVTDFTNTITDADASGQAVANTNGTGTITAATTGNDNVSRALVANRRDTGTLRVGKTVESAVTDETTTKEFSFVLTLDNLTALAGSGTATIRPDDITVERWNKAATPGDDTRDTEYTDYTKNVSGEFTFKLKHNQYIRIAGLPTGVTYTIREVPEDNTAAAANALGQFNKAWDDGTTDGSSTVTTDRTTNDTYATTTGLTSSGAEVDLTNTRDTGSLTLNKDIVNAINGDQNLPFTYQVTLTHTAGTLDLNSIVGSQANLSVSGGKIIATVTSGTPVTIANIPVGTEYTVEEDTTAMPAGANGNIEYNSKANGTGTVGRLDSVSTAGDKAPQATVTNTRKLGNLEISKTVATPIQNDLTDPFRVKLTLNKVPLPAGEAHAYPISARITGTGDADTLHEVNSPDEKADTVGDAATGKVVTFTDGVAYIYIRGGQTVTIADLPTDIVCTVAEVEQGTDGAASGYADYAKDYGAQTSAIAFGTTAVRTITNRRNTGKLTVTKSVVSNVTSDNDTQEFDFTVTLDQATLDTLAGVAEGTHATIIPSEITVNRYTGDSTAPDANFVLDTDYTKSDAGVFTFKLKHGQHVEIEGLPTGVQYTVSEAKSENYITTTRLNNGSWSAEKKKNSDDNDVGTVSDGTTNAAPNDAIEFKNTRKTGTLALSKSLVNAIPGDDEKPFTFNVTLTNANGFEDSAVTGITATGATPTVTRVDAYTVTVSVPVKNSTPVTISGIPVGTTYEVAEAAVTNFTSEVTTSEGTSNNNTIGTGTISIDNAKSTGGDDDAVGITNTRKLGDLAITKTVDSPVEYDRTERSYEVTVTLKTQSGAAVGGTYTIGSNLTPGSNANSSITFDSATGVGTMSIKHGETVTIKNIPTDVVCEIVETADSDFSTAYNPADENDSAIGKVTIESDQTYSETITNTRRRGKLEVGKTVVSAVSADTAVNSSQAFTFHVSLDIDGTGNKLHTPSGITVTKYRKKTGSETADQVVTTNPAIAFDAATATAEFTLSHDQYVVIEGLPAGIGYTVTEDQDPDFKAPVKAYDTGTIGDHTASGYSRPVASFTNTRKTGELTINKAFASSPDHRIGGDDARDFTFSVSVTWPQGGDVDPTTQGAKIQYKQDNETDYHDATTNPFTVIASKDHPVTIIGIPVEATYTVTETRVKNVAGNVVGLSDFETPVLSPNPASVTTERGTTGNTTENGGRRYQQTFTNDRRTNRISITKSVTSTPIDAEYTAPYKMQIALSPVPVTKAYEITAGSGTVYHASGDSVTVTSTTDPETNETIPKYTVAFNDSGVAVVYVRGGQTVTLSGIPTDVTYTVTELDNSRFTTDVTYSSAGRTIAATSDFTATVSNARNTGELRVDKAAVSNVPGDLDGTRTYQFTVAITNLDTLAGVENATVDTSKITVTRYDSTDQKDTAYTGAAVNTNGTITFELKHGQYAVIGGLPVGAAYTVRETGVEKNGVSENLGDNFTTKNGVSLTSLSETSSTQISGNITAADTQYTAAFQNTRRTGSLTINKSLTNHIADDAGDTFYFDVTLVDVDAEAPTRNEGTPAITVGSPAMDWASSASNHGLYFERIEEQNKSVIHNVPVTLAADGTGTVTVYGIPSGTTYSVQESADWTNSRVSYALTPGNITRDNENAVNGNAAMTADATPSLSFTNTRKLGDLQITKKVVSPVSEETTTKAYNIHVTLTTEGGESVSGTFNTSFASVTASTNANGQLSFTNSSTNTTTNYIALKADETVTISGIPMDVVATVTEDDYSNFTTTQAPSENVEIVNNSTASTVSKTVTNTRKLGKLKVAKTVVSNVDADDNHLFEFRVTLTPAASGETLESNFDYGTWADADGQAHAITFSNNVATIYAKHGEANAVTLSNLPIGWTYTVEEIRQLKTGSATEYYTDNFTTAATGATGTIAADLTGNAPSSTAAFTNTRKEGTLTVRKVVDTANKLPGDEGEGFTFTITLTGPDDSALDYSTGEITYQRSCDTEATPFTSDTATVTLKHNEIVTVSHLPVGTSYTVTEADKSFTVNSTPHTGFDAKHALNDATATAGNTVSDSISINSTDNTIGETDTVVYTNTRKTGSLKVAKTVTSPVSQELVDDYVFTVVLTKGGDHVTDATYTITAEDQAGRAVTLTSESGDDLKDGTLTYTFTVKGGGYVTLSGIPVGVAYAITEGTPTTFTSTPTGATGTIIEDTVAQEQSGQTVTPGSAANFANQRNVNSLSVTKILDSDVTQDRNHPFWFRLTMAPPTERPNDTLVTTESHGTDSNNNEIKFTDGLTTEFALIPGSDCRNTVEITNLPAGWSYALTEISNPAAMTTEQQTTEATYLSYFTTTPADETGTIDEDTASAATFTNTRKTDELELNKAITDALPADLDDMFTFVVTLSRTNETLNLASLAHLKIQRLDTTDSTYKDADWAFAADPQNASVVTATVQVSCDRPVKIVGIPVGTHYSVQETDKVETNANIVIPTAVAENTKTGDITVDTCANNTAEQKTITNSRKTNELLLHKTVESPLVAEQTMPYQMKVTLDPLPVEHSYGISADGNLGIATGGDVASNQVTFREVTDQTTGKVTGEAIVYVKGGQTVTISGIPTDVTYTVEELGHPLFDRTYSFEDSNNTGTAATTYAQDTIVADTEDSGTPIDRASKVLVANTRQTGMLRIDKSVFSNVANDDSIDFDFTLSLTNLANLVAASASQNVDPSKITVAKGTTDVEGTTPLYFNDNGTLSFKLAHNQYITVSGLPVGVEYTIVENETSAVTGFTTTNGVDTDHLGATASRTFSDTISAKNESDTAWFRNTRDTGSITINKTLTNAIPVDDGDTFYFDVTLERTGTDKAIAPDANAPITVGGTAITETSATAPEGSHPLYFTYNETTKQGTLHNVPVVCHTQAPVTSGGVTTVRPAFGTVAITGIPVDTGYSVAEADFWTKGTTEYAFDPDTNIQKNTPAAATGDTSGTMDADHRTATARITNNRIATGNLTVTKKLTTAIPAEQAAGYDVTVTLKTKDGGTPANGIHATITRDTGTSVTSVTRACFLNGSEIFILHRDETVTITGIPADLTYTVTEPGYGERFEKTFAIKENGDFADTGQPYATGDIVPNATVDTQVTNTRQYHTLTVVKTISGAMANLNDVFTFTLNVVDDDDTTDAANDTLKDYDYTIVHKDASGTETISGTINTNGTFTLGNHESVVISQIPAHAKVTLTETRGVYTATWVLYKDISTQTLADPQPTITASTGTTLEGTSAAEFTIVEDGVLTIDNHLEPIGPTGVDDDTKPFAMVLFAALAALGLVYMNRRRKRRKPLGSGPGGGGIV